MSYKRNSAAPSSSLLAHLTQRKPEAVGGSGYGLTESNGICAAIGGDQFVYKPAAAGWPLPIVDVRIGDSPEQFYLGHIGYHVDEPFRGHGYARRACLLAAPLLRGYDMRTVVITTDPDNWPSVRTCENLGCVLESTVNVPEKMVEKLEISTVKHRFIWTLAE